MADAAVKDSAEDSAYRRIELITGEPRRRQWTEAEKAEVLAASFRPGASVSGVARRYGVSRSLLCYWRRQARDSAAVTAPAFVPIRITEEDNGGRVPEANRLSTSDTPLSSEAKDEPGNIVIEMGKARVCISGVVDRAVLQQVLAYFGRRA